jgi:hypothetical protein
MFILMPSIKEAPYQTRLHVVTLCVERLYLNIPRPSTPLLARHKPGCLHLKNTHFHHSLDFECRFCCPSHLTGPQIPWAVSLSLTLIPTLNTTAPDITGQYPSAYPCTYDYVILILNTNLLLMAL